MKHMLGEHLEAHIFVSKMQKEYSLNGYSAGSMFFGAAYIKFRHDWIASLLEGHTTPLSLDGIDRWKYPLVEPTNADMLKSVKDLLSRCPECGQKHLEFLRGR